MCTWVRSEHSGRKQWWAGHQPSAVIAASCNTASRVALSCCHAARLGFLASLLASRLATFLTCRTGRRYRGPGSSGVLQRLDAVQERKVSVRAAGALPGPTVASTGSLPFGGRLASRLFPITTTPIVTARMAGAAAMSGRFFTIAAWFAATQLAMPLMAAIVKNLPLRAPAAPAVPRVPLISPLW